jgi:hypothetical protein
MCQLAAENSEQNASQRARIEERKKNIKNSKEQHKLCEAASPVLLRASKG